MIRSPTAFALALLAALSVSHAEAFTYQGELRRDGAPFEGLCDLGFSLFAVASGSDPAIAGPTLFADTPIERGLFTVQIEAWPDAVWTGAPRFLEISVDCGSGASVLQPRQPVSPTPTARYSLRAGVADWSGLEGVPSGFADGVDDDTTYAPGSGLVLTDSVFSVDPGAISLPWSNLDGVPAGFADGVDDDTTYGAGSGLVLTDSVFSVDPGAISLPWANLDGVPAGLADGVDDDTLYSAGSGLSLAGTEFSVNPAAISLPWANLSGVPAGFADGVDNDTDTTYSAGTGLQLIGTQFSVPGNTFWGAGGNAGTTAGTHYLGTSDNVALELRANNRSALRIVPHATSPVMLGGSGSNTAAAGIAGASIGGGGASGSPNAVGGNFATIAGGLGNTAQSANATVGGGEANQALGANATVAGGQGNLSSGSYSSALSGRQNQATNTGSLVAGGQTNTATGQYSAVVGGVYNDATNTYSFVGGGINNQAAGAGTVVGGGQNNNANSTLSAILGGSGNTTIAEHAVVLGGRDNVAGGEASLAAGVNAHALHEGSFVWNGDPASKLESPAPRSFVARSAGGFWFGNGGEPRIREGVLIDTSSGAFLPAGGAWTNSSDRTVKANFAPVDALAVLDKVVAMPLSVWNYIAEGESVRHLGPMAQDFHAAFGLGPNDTSITTIDADGVALAAIQGLHARLQEREATIASLQAQQRWMAGLMLAGFLLLGWRPWRR